MAYEDANSLTITGQVVGDPEYVVDESGEEVCRFSLEYAYRYKDREGWQTDTTILTCVHHRLSEWFRANIVHHPRVCLQGRLLDDGEYYYLDVSYLKTMN